MDQVCPLSKRLVTLDRIQTLILQTTSGRPMHLKAAFRRLLQLLLPAPTASHSSTKRRNNRPCLSRQIVPTADKRRKRLPGSRGDQRRVRGTLPPRPAPTAARRRRGEVSARLPEVTTVVTPAIFPALVGKERSRVRLHSRCTTAAARVSLVRAYLPCHPHQEISPKHFLSPHPAK